MRRVVSAILVAASISSVFGQAGYLFLHPAMKGKPWRTTLNNLNFDAPEDLLTLAPGTYASGNRIRKTVAAFVSQNNRKLYVMKSEYRSRCVDVLRYHSPTEVPVPAFPTADLPLHVITTTDTSFDTARVTYPLPSGDLRITTILTDGGMVIDSQDVSLSGITAAEDILHVSTETDSVDKVDTLLWITGVNGAIRSIPLTPAGTAGTETIHDIGAADITAFGNGYAGSASGALYVLDRQSGTFSQVFEGLASPSVWIEGNSVLTETGVLLYPDGNTWSTADLGIPDARRFQPLKMPGGSAVQLLDGQWRDSLIVYRDAPTILTAEPESLNQFLINHDTLNLDQSSAMFKFILSDPDGNTSVPEMIWYGDHSNDSVLLLENNSGALLNRAPNAPCNPGDVRLAGDTITLVIDESIMVHAPARSAEQDLICSSCKWTTTHYTTENNFDRGQIRVSLGNRSISIHYHSGGTVSGTSPVSLIDCENETVSPGRGVLQFRFTRTAAANLRSIRIYDSRGRTVARLSSIHPGTLTTTGRLAPGMVHIRYLYTDGRSRTESSFILP